MMTIEERIKQIEGRLEKSMDRTDYGSARLDIRFLLSELKRRGEALSQYSNPKNWSNGGFDGEYDTIWMGKGLRGSDIAQQALHPEGVK